MLQITNTRTQTMSSREIAELTGKQHKDVLYDVRKMLIELELSTADFTAMYKADNGQEYELFNLPKRETLILTSGYSIALRAKIIDRWQELESNQIAQKELSRKDILLLALEAEERAEIAEARVERLVFNNTYLIANDGFIVSMPKKWAVGCNGGNKSHNGKVLSQPLVNGYLKVRIKYPDGKRKLVSVHRLVAETFISNPENKPQVNHINGIKTDNRVKNLEWVTAKENNTHAILNGLSHVKKGKNSNAKPVINTLGEIYKCARDADDSLNYKYGTVSKSIRRGNLCGGVKWSFIPAKWTALGREFILDFCEKL